MEEKIYSVTEFNKMVKGYIDENPNFQEFFLKGVQHLIINLKE